MKKCPHCGHSISFLNFLIRLGSDTLISHPMVLGIHDREHVCSHCGKMIWLEYQLQKEEKEFGRNIPVLLTSLVLTFLFGRILLNLNNFGASIFTAMLMMFIVPIYLSWVKYESVNVKGNGEKGK